MHECGANARLGRIPHARPFCRVQDAFVEALIGAGSKKLTDATCHSSDVIIAADGATSDDQLVQQPTSGSACQDDAIEALADPKETATEQAPEQSPDAVVETAAETFPDFTINAENQTDEPVATDAAEAPSGAPLDDEAGPPSTQHAADQETNELTDSEHSAPMSRTSSRKRRASSAESTGSASKKAKTQVTPSQAADCY